MKKFLVLVVTLALLAPVSAFAAAEFSLGGFIKLNTFWDSTQNNSNLTNPIQRDNNANFHHGRFNMKAQESRFNFTIKGPKVFGAQTTGIIEIDFDGTQDNSGVSSSGTWLARMRLAMFRLTWPETELMLGQYHSLLAAWSVEGAESSALQATGTVTARLPQIRLTQKFLGDWSVAGLVGLPNNATLDTNDPYGAGTGSNGADAETPQLQGSITYAHDWWGKAAYFGHPKPFTAQVTAAWQRSINRYATGVGLMTFGNNNYVNLANATILQNFVSPWVVRGTLFIPVIPTHSANLAGTAHLLTQWWVGQGVEAFGMAGTSSNLYKFDFANVYEASLLRRFGGMVEGQYYINNQWFINVAYGISKAYGVDTSAPTIQGQDAFLRDQQKMEQQVDATVWYRPVQALKFGLQYSFAQSQWFQETNTAAVGGTPQLSKTGNEHRVQFVGFFFF